MRNSSHQLERTPIGPLKIPKDETGSSIYFKSSCDGIHMGFSNIKIKAICLSDTYPFP